MNETSEGWSWPARLDLVKFVATALYISAPRRAVIGSRAEGNNLKKFPIVHGEQRVEQVRKRVICKVIRDITNPELSALL